MTGAGEAGLVGAAGMAAGLVNALAGGGTLISFPALMAVGLPPVAANVTNTVSLCPGFLGATQAQWRDLAGQRRRLWLFVPAAVAGGLAGGLVLLGTGERAFRSLVPFLILLASALLALQGPLRGWLARRAARQGAGAVPERWAAVPIGIAAIYGGYFGAGLSVIILALLGLTVDDSLTRLSAIKQAIAASVNLSAAVLFAFSGRVDWTAAAVMALGALLGGSLGGRFASRVRPETLRWTVVAIGVVVSAIYLAR